MSEKDVKLGEEFEAKRTRLEQENRSLNEKLEKSTWFSELITLNKEDLIKEKEQTETKLDDDFLLIPHLIEKTILLRLISIAENVYDPMSSRQTKHFSGLLFQLIKDYPTLNHQSSNTKVIF